MSILSRQKDGNTVVVNNTEIPLSKGAVNKARERITAPAMQNTLSLPQIRKKKILAVQQQLAEGRYDLDKRLDVALERLLVAVNT